MSAYMSLLILYIAVCTVCTVCTVCVLFVSANVSVWVCLCLPLWANAHHDTSDADAHVADDVEFAVEEFFDAHLTVLW